MQIKVNIKNFGFFLILLFFVYLIYLLIFGAAANQKLPDLSIDIKDLINYCVFAAESGGYAINRIQNEKFYWKSSKASNSGLSDELLTKADLVSNQLIREILDRAPGLHIISEEKTKTDEKLVEKYKQNNYFLWTKHKQYIDLLPSDRYLLSDIAVWVDPLDATQEFTEDLLHYVTVMLCITVRGRPKFGVIHRPFNNQTVWGLVGYGTHPNFTTATASSSGDSAPPIALVSRSHAGRVTDFLRKSLGAEASNLKIEPAGGAGYKSLRVANGSAAMYVHLTSIKKWDLCAPDALIRSAGGRMTTLDGDDLTYFSKDKNVVNTRGLLVTLNEYHFKYLAKFSPIWNDGRVKL